MSNLITRGITGFFFVAIIVSAIVMGGWYSTILWALVSVLTLNEFYGLFKNTTYAPNIVIGLIIGIGIYALGFYAPNQLLLIGIFAIFPLVGLLELFRKKETPFQNIGLTITGILYVTLPFFIINHLRLTNDNYWMVLGLFIMVWSSDTFAYLIGRQIGKHKLFERISPKKSWEGFIGGMLFSMLAGGLIAHFTDESIVKFLIYGAIISTFGTLGDLVESMLKRSLNIKDSGNILPGHGGLLDRFDAVIFVTPIIFCAEYLIQYFG
ncbi:MAG: phosphatidate cytidylyltransferase [Putridiphycobacter sp.]